MQGHLEDCRLPLSLHSALTGRHWSGRGYERKGQGNTLAQLVIFPTPCPHSRQVDDSTRETLGFLKLTFPACLAPSPPVLRKDGIIQHPSQPPLSMGFYILSWPTNFGKTLVPEPSTLPPA